MPAQEARSGEAPQGLSGLPRHSLAQQVAVDDRLCDTNDLQAMGAGEATEHRECPALVDLAALHENGLGALGQRAAAEGALQVMVRGEAAEREVQRAPQSSVVPSAT